MKQFNSGPSINTYNKLSHWFDFSNPGILRVYSGKIDIGQHISSTLALITSNITEIKYDQIEIIKLSTDISPDEGITASSLSVANSGSAIKAASIALKINFLNYALENLEIKNEDILFENGVIKDKNSNKTISYWDFAKTVKFKDLIIPEIFDENSLKKINYRNNQKIELKTINEIVTGKYKYVHDINFPNMLHARIVRPPSYHCKLIKINEDFKKRLFENEIKKRNISPTKFLPLWDLLGLGLGFGSTILGKKAAMLCTASVEEVIDEHYLNQIKQIKDDEKKLREKIKKFRQDEIDHKDIAYEEGATKKGLYSVMDKVIKTGSRIAINISEKI